MGGHATSWSFDNPTIAPDQVYDEAIGMCLSIVMTGSDCKPAAGMNVSIASCDTKAPTHVQHRCANATRLQKDSGNYDFRIRSQLDLSLCMAANNEAGGFQLVECKAATRSFGVPGSLRRNGLQGWLSYWAYNSGDGHLALENAGITCLIASQ